VEGRIGANAADAPYQNPFVPVGDGSGSCASNCTSSTADSWGTCGGANGYPVYRHVITVYRDFDPDAYYSLCNVQTGLCLNGADTSSSKVPFTTQASGVAPGFRFTRLGSTYEGPFEIRGANTDKVYLPSTLAGTELSRRADVNGTLYNWDLFSLTQLTGNMYLVHNTASGLLLNGDGRTAGQAPYLASQFSTYAQAWTLRLRTGDSSLPSNVPLTFKNQANGLVLNTASWSSINGYPIVQSAEAAKLNQRWQLIPAAPGYYYVTNMQNGLRLTPEAWSTQPATRIIQWPADVGMATSQQWALRANGSGYELVNRVSGLVVTPDAWSASAGTQLIAWYSYSVSQQVWSIQ